MDIEKVKLSLFGLQIFSITTILSLVSFAAGWVVAVHELLSDPNVVVVSQISVELPAYLGTAIYSLLAFLIVVTAIDVWILIREYDELSITASADEMVD